ncbi:NAD(P)H-dependent oxidoreductase [Sphingobacterium sp. SYP-B4668]|uniref:NAD(P)H-dependent oxidoreductase n=1 Tax=Sphingobacterium sp. SYP-B4668 TaxID=2996035 RepID=UPI0022DE559F|nr:NAD(P)H-dependent oxidoreductase [Sphingobacterium sp. SYP-B4668]
MKKILIINAGQHFGHSGGKYNDTIAEATFDFFKDMDDVEVQMTRIADGYDEDEEVRKFVWADYIIYHTPIWWFQLPFEFKKYIDVVFTAGHQKGIYNSDGRSSKHPAINYGTGGALAGRKYLLTTSWNAPQTAFTLPGEFFQERTVDDGPLFGFHRMNAFASLTKMEGFHFHDVEKNANMAQDKAAYLKHLGEVFAKELEATLC